MSHDGLDVMTNTEATGFIPAVLYAAKSTQDKHRSIPTQLDDGRAMAAEHGWTACAEHSDEGFSAYSGNRGDGFAQAKARAVELAREHGSCMLVAQAADRFARGSGDKPGAADALIEIWHAMRRQGVELRSVEDDFDLRSSSSVANLGERAHMDSRRKGTSVAKGTKRRRADGKHSGGPRKYGYDYVRDNYGRTVADEPLRIVEAKALTIARIYRDYDAGQSQQSIQRALNREGVPTTRGKTWHQGTIAKILADPFYAGWVVDGDDLVAGRHPAIVDVELWERVKRRREEGARTKRGGRPPARPYLFTHGLLRCGRCGGAMVPRTSDRRNPNTGKTWGKRYEVYRCLNRIRDVTTCDQPPLPRAAVDEIALADLEARGVSVERTRRQTIEALGAELAAVVARLDEAERQERAAAEAVERIDRDYASGALSASNYERLAPKFAAELDGARAEREQIASRATELRARPSEVDDVLSASLAELRQAIAAYLRDAGNVEEVRFHLRRLFARFVARPSDEGTVIVAELREDALDALIADVSASKREALRLTSTTDAIGLQT